MKTVLAFAFGASSTALLLYVWRRTAAVAHSSKRRRCWRPGQPQPAPFTSSKWIQVNPETAPKPDLYALTISSVVPRPIAFVSSESAAGVPNLAPYSYFNAMNHDPPIITIGCCHSASKQGGKKDTLANIEETGEFVVNIISDWFAEAANHTSGDFPSDVDEMAAAGLHPVPSVVVRPPRVKESAVQLECRLRHIHQINGRGGNPSGAIVIGEVVMFHIHEEVAGQSPSGKLIVDPRKLRPVARMGGVTYAAMPELFDLARPDGKGNYPQK